jgi:hypothetical protein
MNTTLRAAPHDRHDPDQPPRPDQRAVTDGPDRAQRRREREESARPGASSHVDESESSHRRRLRHAYLRVGVLSLTDAIIIKTTWNQVLLQAEIISWILAICTAIGGAALMWVSGALAAKAQLHPNRILLIVSGCAVLAWAALGAGLFWMRWNAAELAGDAVVLEGQVADDSSAQVHQLMAIVMIALYLLPGVLAWADGYTLSHPVEARQRRSYARLSDLTTRIARVEAEAVKVAQLLQLHADEIALVTDRANQAKRANASLAAELRAYARGEVLRRLGTPNAGDITHPDEQPPSTRRDDVPHDTRGTYPGRA